MTQFLPPNLLALFAPRDPIPYLPPLEKLPHEKHHNQPYSGIAPYIREFEDPRDAPPPTRAETREERMERKRREKIERRQQEVESELKMWDPHNDPNAQGDAFKTLFVARVNYDTTESKLRREFEVYGPIKRIYMVYNKRSGKPRGYAFIEYEHERDMHSTFLMAFATAGLQLILVLPLPTPQCMVGIRVCILVRHVSNTPPTPPPPRHQNNTRGEGVGRGWGGSSEPPHPNPSPPRAGEEFWSGGWGKTHRSHPGCAGVREAMSTPPPPYPHHHHHGFTGVWPPPKFTQTPPRPLYLGGRGLLLVPPPPHFTHPPTHPSAVGPKPCQIPPPQHGHGLSLR
ncbi:U1 small nuclear ribonucleoprotein 70 kDa isoform X2 [Phalacrocorax carbo]|uniref:U1 small nuclear ribonucleoprotein 70 kDa isoform X2 n=1 Tax=Phalacrocorax carbo TaxID=9209 RepID=UPI003119487E